MNMTILSLLGMIKFCARNKRHTMVEATDKRSKRCVFTYRSLDAP